MFWLIVDRMQTNSTFDILIMLGIKCTRCLVVRVIYTYARTGICLSDACVGKRVVKLYSCRSESCISRGTSRCWISFILQRDQCLRCWLAVQTRCVTRSTSQHPFFIIAIMRYVPVGSHRGSHCVRSVWSGLTTSPQTPQAVSPLMDMPFWIPY